MMTPFKRPWFGRRGPEIRVEHVLAGPLILWSDPECARLGHKSWHKLLQAGADHVVVTEQEDLPKRIMDISDGKGADVIFDPVSGPYVDTLAQAAATGATLLMYGALDMRPTPYPLFPALQKGLWMHAFTLFESTTQPAARERAKRYVYEGLKSGVLNPTIDPKVFSLDHIVDAHRYLESNQQFGKIVVRV